MHNHVKINNEAFLKTNESSFTYTQHCVKRCINNECVKSMWRYDATKSCFSFR